MENLFYSQDDLIGAIELKASEQKIKEKEARIIAIEKDLNKKDNALAETTALLVLSKKKQAILGNNKED